jgi:hypothetical protein
MQDADWDYHETPEETKEIDAFIELFKDVLRERIAKQNAIETAKWLDED